MQFHFNYLAIFILFGLFSCNSRIIDEDRTNQKIIIIGAGMAGLSAANELKDRGYTPIVLEAQDRVGGRVRTDRSLGIAFDEGASWIHGPIDNPITGLAQQAGANTYLTDDESVLVFAENGQPYDDDTLATAEQQYNQLIGQLNGDSERSFADVFYAENPQLQNQPLWTYMLSAYLEFDTGGDIYQLSSTDFYDDEAFEGEDLIITNGYDLIPQYLARNIDVRLNTRVTAIDYSGNEILITTNNGEYRADKVLVTVPLGVLKKNAIAFTPQLPTETQAAIESLEMGAVNKFLLTWEASFWPEDLQYIGYTPEEKGKFNYFLNVKKFADANALMTFTFGEYSKQTEEMTDEQIIEEIMQHLRAIYGENIPAPTNLLRTRWNTNPNSYGAYSFATPGIGSDAFEVFEEPINRKIYFAGEHTILDYRGTVHGAYLSGIREARKMAR